jgi:D-amino-acid oxidase
MLTVPDLPTPDFTFDPDAPGACIAGVRPYREGSYRLDAESVSGKFVVHNYGHGGAGITLSWGCADKVQGIVQEHLVASRVTEVAVLGAGVMGLTAATLLLDLGLKVTIYSDRNPVETTSFRAGGQWAASVVECQGKEQEFGSILQTAYEKFTETIGKGYGVSMRPNYSKDPTHGLEVVRSFAPCVPLNRMRLQRLPFEAHTEPGYVYQTLLVEPPIFLPRLEADLRARGVSFVHRHFASASDVLMSLTQEIVVNCTGLGARTLWHDPKVKPVKGQLAMLRPQPELQYLYGQNGYLFPRADHVVIGGTFEPDRDDEVPNKGMCKELVRHMASLFGKAPRRPLPEFHIHHPRNAPMVQSPLVGVVHEA